MNWLEKLLTLLGIRSVGEIHYIGGAEVLPPPLKGQQEPDMILAAQEGQKEARQRLIDHNLRLAVYIARRFENTGIPLEELISIGTIGLIKGVETYRQDKNIKLATYASRCIENEILMHLRKVSNQKTEVSLDEPINTDGDGNELLLADILGTDPAAICRPLEEQAERQLLRQALTTLAPRETDIVELR